MPLRAWLPQAVPRAVPQAWQERAAQLASRQQALRALAAQQERRQALRVLAARRVLALRVQQRAQQRAQQRVQQQAWQLERLQQAERQALQALVPESPLLAWPLGLEPERASPLAWPSVLPLVPEQAPLLASEPLLAWPLELLPVPSLPPDPISPLEPLALEPLRARRACSAPHRSAFAALLASLSETPRHG